MDPSVGEPSSNKTEKSDDESAHRKAHFSVDESDSNARAKEQETNVSEEPIEHDERSQSRRTPLVRFADDDNENKPKLRRNHSRARYHSEGPELPTADTRYPTPEMLSSLSNADLARLRQHADDEHAEDDDSRPEPPRLVNMSLQPRKATFTIPDSATEESEAEGSVTNEHPPAKPARIRPTADTIEDNQNANSSSARPSLDLGSRPPTSHLASVQSMMADRASPALSQKTSTNTPHSNHPEDSHPSSAAASPSSSDPSVQQQQVETAPAPPERPKMESASMASQVEDDDLHAKTISTQTSNGDLKVTSPRFNDNGHADYAEQIEMSDKVDDNTLRPAPSNNQPHGILRKTPSCSGSQRWGSSSTVAFEDLEREDPDGDRRNSMASDQDPSNIHHHRHSSRNSSSNDLRSHGKSKSGKRDKLALFHLGSRHRHDEPDSSDSESSQPPTPRLKKHHGSFASFAHFIFPNDEQHKKMHGDNKDVKVQKQEGRGPGMPFWKRPFQKKKAMPRSFTVDDLKKDLEMDDHTIDQQALLDKLKVNLDTGLSEEEAGIRLARDGKNALTPPKTVPEIVKLMRAMVGGFSPFLIIGAILCFIAYGIQVATTSDPAGDNLYLAIVLLVVVLVTGLFLYYQNAKSEAIMEGFKKMMPQEANVLRGGKVQKISADDVVLGDVVDVAAGDRVPADVRVLAFKTLKVDNSSLTGESEPQSRSAESSDNPLESKNLLFYTTNVVEGSGRGVVIKRGDNTVMGRIAKLTTNIGSSETTIAREMHHFIIIICILALGMGGIIFIVALCVGYGGFYAIVLAIGLVVANVPEGVIVTVTVMLTLTAQRMARKNCLIKNLEAVETLGACSVICSDKTGTLTQNRMTVSHTWVDESVIGLDTVTEEQAGSNVPDTPAAQDLIRVATLCNRATWKEGQEDKRVYARECKGDASETALLKFTHLVLGDALAYRAERKAVAEIPFNSTTKFQVSVHEIDIEGRTRYLVAMKGAPERIWDRCKTIASHGQEFATDKSYEKRFTDAYAELGGMGERVLGFCDLLLPEDQFPYPTEFNIENPNFPVEGLRFLGLISLIDPPRAAVPDGVAKCRSAGIQVIMVTGDHPLTAKAIARNVGIISEGTETVEDIAARKGIAVKDVDPREANAVVIHGTDLKDMSEEELENVLFYHAEIVFARTSPQQKLIIVEACQRLGAVVAVTGDGVNDSPALKKAHIGIAMGITGSDVSKQAADMVLLDDNFASIVTGIEEGRLIFDNLKKTICYTLMANIPEIMPVLLYFILKIPIGLTTIPMLLVCIGTDMVPSFSMAHEPAENDIMKLPPRSDQERLVDMKLLHVSYLQAGMICAAGTFFTYFVVFAELGFWPYILFGIRDDFEDTSIQDLEDSYGQQWTYSQRLYLSRVVQGAFFASIVVFQWFDVIIRRVRRISVFQKPLKNHFMNFGILFETALACLCIYVPGLNYALNLYTIRFVWWLPMLPFAFYFLVFDECRRYLIRRYPGGWTDREFYF